MNKAEMIEAVSEQAGLTKADAERALNAFIATTISRVKTGEEVMIVGFGTFKGSPRAARTGRNPRTGEAIQIPASVAATFKAGKAFKDEVNS